MHVREVDLGCIVLTSCTYKTRVIGQNVVLCSLIKWTNLLHAAKLLLIFAKGRTFNIK